VDLIYLLALAALYGVTCWLIAGIARLQQPP
jgi:hypothetical protein